jgi:hypothetical protein
MTGAVHFAANTPGSTAVEQVTPKRKVTPIEDILKQILSEERHLKNLEAWMAALVAEGVTTETDLLDLPEKNFDMLKVPAVFGGLLRDYREQSYRRASGPSPRTCYVSVRILSLIDVNMSKNCFKMVSCIHTWRNVITVCLDSSSC